MDRKQALLDAAVKLFATNGYDATSTASIARYAGVTEPLIHYHFKSKDGLFTHILNEIFESYLGGLDKLPAKAPTQFEKLRNLIEYNFTFAAEFPDQTFIVISACPAKLQDAAHICARYEADLGARLTDYIEDCLKKGIKAGEFHKVPVKATIGVILAMINGLLRRKILNIDKIKGLGDTAVDFCRRALCVVDH